jgi:hypothetical protein
MSRTYTEILTLSTEPRAIPATPKTDAEKTDVETIA